jgi:hypothetical protein
VKGQFEAGQYIAICTVRKSIETASMKRLALSISITKINSDLARAELSAPGRDVAYVVKTRRSFGK